jgi:hypothetical protein
VTFFGIMLTPVFFYVITWFDAEKLPAGGEVKSSVSGEPS